MGHRLDPAPKDVRNFGLILIPFAAAFGGVAWWRADALVGVAMILGAALVISWIFNRNNRLRQLSGVLIPGICLAVGLPTRFGVDPLHIASGVWIAGGVVALFTIGIPALGKILFVEWTRSAEPIGWTITHLLLAMVYYLVITPIGLVMRMVGRDPLQRRLDPDAKTYWIEHATGDDPASYFKQY